MGRSLLLLGDSIGKGTIYSPQSAGYEILKDSFIQLFGKERGFHITNLSRYGCTVSKGKSILMRHMDEMEEKDTIFLEFGGNDCCYDWRAVSDDPEKEHGPRTPLVQFRQIYKEIIEKLKATGKKIILFNLPPLEAERYFSWVTRNKNPENILKYLGGNKQYIYRWHEMYSAEIHKIAEEENVVLMDIRSVFLKLKHYADYLCIDGIHPNAAGHRLIADYLKEQNI